MTFLKDGLVGLGWSPWSAKEEAKEASKARPRKLTTVCSPISCVTATSR